jgi:hypothetical protein
VTVTLLWIALSLISPSPAPAASATPSSAEFKKPIDPAAISAGLRLAEFIYDEASQAAAASRMVDIDIGPAFRSSPDFKALEAEYPGFIEAVLTEIRPLMVSFSRDMLPEYRGRAAEIYASHLTAAEIEDLFKFYQTPTGQKMIKSMTQDRSMCCVWRSHERPG